MQRGAQGGGLIRAEVAPIFWDQDQTLKTSAALEASRNFPLFDSRRAALGWWLLYRSVDQLISSPLLRIAWSTTHYAAPRHMRSAGGTECRTPSGKRRLRVRRLISRPDLAFSGINHLSTPANLYSRRPRADACALVKLRPFCSTWVGRWHFRSPPCYASITVIRSTASAPSARGVSLKHSAALRCGRR